jgi:hypothetical protein
MGRLTEDMKRPKLDSFPVILVFAIIASQAGPWIVRSLNHDEPLGKSAFALAGGVSIGVALIALTSLERWLVRRDKRQS